MKNLLTNSKKHGIITMKDKEKVTLQTRKVKRMEQIVYVVLDSKEKKVIGAYNEYKRAEQIALDMERACYNGTEISITPVCVDRDNIVNGTRQYLLNQQDVLDATIEEMELACPEGAIPVRVDDEDEDDEYDVDDDEYEEDEDEDEDDDEYEDDEYDDEGYDDDEEYEDD